MVKLSAVFITHNCSVYNFSSQTLHVQVSVRVINSSHVTCECAVRGVCDTGLWMSYGRGLWGCCRGEFVIGWKNRRRINSVSYLRFRGPLFFSVICWDWNDGELNLLSKIFITAVTFWESSILLTSLMFYKHRREMISHIYTTGTRRTSSIYN